MPRLHDRRGRLHETGGTSTHEKQRAGDEIPKHVAVLSLRGGGGGGVYGGWATPQPPTSPYHPNCTTLGFKTKEIIFWYGLLGCVLDKSNCSFCKRTTLLFRARHALGRAEQRLSLKNKAQACADRRVEKAGPILARREKRPK
jgi:hypothetical protein